MDDNRGSRKAIVLVLVVFLLGGALGALGMYVSAGRVWGARPEGRQRMGPGGARTRMVERLSRELTLSADQQKQLDGILQDMQGKYDAIHKQIAPQTEQVRQQGREQIRGILTPEQRTKFDDYMRRQDEERKKFSNR